MGEGPEKKEAPPSRETSEKSPDVAAAQARAEYQKKWASMRAKIDECKISPNPALKALAARYDQRMKRETPDPQKIAPVLDEEAIKKNLEKIRLVLDQFEKEPVIKYMNGVTFHRTFLQDTIKKFPHEPLFKKALQDFEKIVKQLGNPTTDESVTRALIKISESSYQNAAFTEAYNREYATATLTTYLGNRIRDIGREITSSDTITSIQVRLERRMNKKPGELRRILTDPAKPKGSVPDQLDFTTRGLYIRITNDGKVALIGASERAKRENQHLAVLPTLPLRGEPIERATEEEQRLAQNKYDEALSVYRQESYATALKGFQDSYLVVASPNTHFMMVLCYEKLGLISRAKNESKNLVAEAEKAAKTDPRYARTAEDARALIARLNKSEKEEAPVASRTARRASRTESRT